MKKDTAKNPKDKKNGQDKPEALTDTTPLSNNDPDPSKRPPPVVAKKSFETALTTPEGKDNIRYLVEAGEDPRDLLMRSVIPTKRTEAYRLMIAILTVLAKSIEFEDTAGADEMRDMLALLPSIDGQSRNQLVQTFIGGYFGNDSNPDNAGMKEKLRRIAMGSGGGG